MNLPTLKFSLKAQAKRIMPLALVSALIPVLNILLPIETAKAADLQLLPSAWRFAGANGAAERYQSIPQTALQGKSKVRITYDLNGSCIYGGDASAVIFDQPVGGNWRYVSLSSYGRNCFDGGTNC